MDEFIQLAMKSLGSDAGSTRAATGGILKLFKKHADGADFKQLLGALPGADAIMKEGPAPGLGEGLGGIVGEVVGQMTGKPSAGEAIGSLSFLTRSGLDIGRITKLVPLFLQFARSKAGADLVARIAGTVPELDKIGV